jgi:hypothetical protein
MDTVSDDLDSAAREQLLASLMELPARDFASRQLLDRVPWLFSDRSQYIDWKAALAADLEIDPYMLLVVGSAATGFSLSPWKGFTAFHPLSDVDVAVVSMRHFDDAWRWLRDLGPEKLLSKFDRDMFTWHRKNLVFDGAIATEKLLPRLSFGPKWASGLGHVGKREPTIGRAVKARIYRDFESLRKYHETNISELKLRLSSEEVDSMSKGFPRLGGANEAMESETGDEAL